MPFNFKSAYLKFDMNRLLFSSALLVLATNSFASSLMDVSPGDKLARVANLYQQQVVEKGDGTVALLDMEGSNPAYVFLDVGALDTIVGTAWVSTGSDESELHLFDKLITQAQTHNTTIKRQDNILACTVIKGGRPFEVKSKTVYLDDETKMSYTQALAFSTITLARGSAKTDKFKVPDTFEPADKLVEQKDKLNPYQKTWAISYKNQLTNAINNQSDVKFCDAARPRDGLVHPFKLGESIEEGTLEFHTVSKSTEFKIGEVTFTEANVGIVNHKINQVGYAKTEVTVLQYQSALKALTDQLGAPMITASTISGDKTTYRFAWTDATYSHWRTIVQYSVKNNEPGLLQIAVQP